MNFLIIYETSHKEHLVRVQDLVQAYDKFIQVTPSTWIINCDGDPLGIKNYLSQIISIDDSLLVLELNKEWATTNFLDVSEWLMKVE